MCFSPFFLIRWGQRKNLENLVPLKKILKNKTKSPLKIRMFAKIWTLIEGLEKKI